MAAEPSPVTKAGRPGSSWRCKRFPCSISLLTPAVRNHCPLCEMPIGTGSKLALSINSKILRAELMDTPCSTERPPYRIATFIRIYRIYKIREYSILKMIRICWISMRFYHQKNVGSVRDKDFCAAQLIANLNPDDVNSRFSRHVKMLRLGEDVGNFIIGNQLAECIVNLQSYRFLFRQIKSDFGITPVIIVINQMVGCNRSRIRIVVEEEFNVVNV